MHDYVKLRLILSHRTLGFYSTANINSFMIEVEVQSSGGME